MKEKLIERLEKQKSKLSIKSLQDLPEPAQMKNLVEAARFIKEGILEGENILIVGDYDTDGIMATTILYGFLTEIGNKDNISYIIPSRLKDGYGLSKNIIDYALENGFTFIITVDNGIAAVDAIAKAKEAGLKVVVTDHHTAPAILPPADFIVNPRVPGETFPFTMISGATVAWYLVAALRIEFNAKVDLRKYLDFVAITIISDVMPLNDINIALFKKGLEIIKTKPRLIYELVWNEYRMPVVDETSIGFDLVPKINAIGRIDDANAGVELFLSKDRAKISELFGKLSNINEERKDITKRMLSDAEYYLENLPTFSDEKAIIVRHKDFHEGVVGIIAGKLAEKYKRPAFVFGFNEEKNVWKGSGRSTGEIHLYDLINKSVNGIIGVNFGGHKGAIGIGIPEDLWEQVTTAIFENAALIPDEMFLNKDTFPIECDLKEFDHETLEILEGFKPFGEGNPKPIFETKSKIVLTKEMKNGQHFKADLISGDKILSGLFFNVEKDKFVNKIEQSSLHTFTFYPSKGYDPKKEQVSFELICSI